MILQEKEKAINILKRYAGSNPEIKRLKYKIEKDKTFALNELNYEYVLNNHSFEPVAINKNIKIAEWYGEYLKKQNELDFQPSLLGVSYLVGETSNIYHLYCRWRQSMEYTSLFVPKKAVLGQLIETDLSTIELDFELLNKLMQPVGRHVLPHQEDAIRFLLCNGFANKLLCDDQGLGKTTEVLGASILGEFKKILIISPSGMKLTWKKELSYFGIEDNQVSILEGESEEKWDLAKKYTICNYDIFSSLHKIAYKTIIDPYSGKEKKVKNNNKDVIKKTNESNVLLQQNYDLCVVDEAHRLSNTKSATWKSIDGFFRTSKVPNIWLMSGTPLTNTNANYYAVLKIIDAEITRDYVYFMKTYCGAKKMRLKTGRELLVPKEDTNTNELMLKTKHLYLRRMKTDLDNLPKKTVKMRYYDLTDKERMEYKQLWAEYEQKKIVEDGFDILQVGELDRKLLEGGICRQWLSTAMVPRTIELADQHLAQGSKVVIACCFDEEIRLLKEHYGDKAVIYNGKLSPKQKEEHKNEFINNPSVTVFISNIKSGGVGITLTCSNVLIFNTFEWVPGSNFQMQDRIHRIGQTKDVTIYYQLFNSTYLWHVWNTIMKKEVTINEVIKEEKEK